MACSKSVLPASKEDFSEEIEEVTSVYDNDIDAAPLSMQLEILGTSFSENKTSQLKATIHDALRFLCNLSDSQ